MPLQKKEQQFFYSLISKYKKGECSPEEKAFIEQYLHILDYRNPGILQDFEYEKQAIGNDIKNRLNQSIAELEALNQPDPLKITRRSFTIKPALKWAAVFLALVFCAAMYFIFHDKQDNAVAINKLIIQPGSDKAVLTLSDGTNVVLDDSLNTQIKDINTFVDVEDGVLTYKVATGNTNNSSYNTMTVPRGGQYKLILADGSKVWLNSASSIKYPVVFNDDERKVFLKGEAYFEVQANKNKPFNVVHRAGNITVLGTSFNVNVYNDEQAAVTTLLQGKIAVDANNAQVVLSPGQQAIVEGDTKIKVKNDADINVVMGWQKGIFEFSSADLPTIARQLSRWYNVDITAEKGSEKIELGGGIAKKTAFEDILKILEANGIKYRWKKNTLILYKAG